MRLDVLLKKKRELNLTNAQLAEISGLTLSNVDKIMSGANSNPSLSTLSALAKALGCTLDDFDETFHGVPSNERFYIRTDGVLFSRVVDYQTTNNISTFGNAACALLVSALDSVDEANANSLHSGNVPIDKVFTDTADRIRNGSPEIREVISRLMYVDRFKNLSEQQQALIEKSISNIIDDSNEA